MKNFIRDGKTLSLACTDPATPASGDPVRVGSLMGVAETAKGDGGNSSTQTTVRLEPGVFDVSVKAVDDAGNSAVAIGDRIFYVDADTPKLSKKASGRVFGYALEAITSGSTDTINVLKVGPGVGGVVKGVYSFDLTTAKIIAANAIGNLTEGMLPDGNSAPSLARVNGATDKQLRLIWAAGSAVEVQFPSWVYPPDLDDTAPVTVHVLASMAGATDTPTITVAAFEGVGDTDCGGATGAVTGTAVAKYTRVLAASDIGAYPNALAISLTPGAHGTDALNVYACWVEYTKK